MAMEAKWEEGLWLGHTRSSNEVLVGTTAGIVKAYAVRRRPLGERWDDKIVFNLKATPSGWNTDEAATHELPSPLKVMASHPARRRKRRSTAMRSGSESMILKDMV